MEKIIIVIDPAGQVKVETKGFKGSGCMAASKFIEETLGTVTATKKTGEYYEEAEKETVRISKNGN